MSIIEKTKAYGEKAVLLGQVAKFMATQTRYDLNYVPPGQNREIFVSAAEAARMIKPGSAVISAGMASHSRSAIFFLAIREAYQKTHQPSDLTWVTVSAQGGRGKLRATVEEVGLQGLIKEYVTAHVETAHSQLELGKSGDIEIHLLPQGVFTNILAGQGEGRTTCLTDTGIGTFLDPEFGGGSSVTPNTSKDYVKRVGDQLEYSLPLIDVALFSAPYADKEGNIYFTNASAITEITECAHAAKYNGGLVLATVSEIIEKDESRISLPASAVDHIVVSKRNEQTITVKQSNYLPMFTEGASVDIDKSVKKLQILNEIMAVSPKRGPIQNCLARMAASMFVKVAKKGNLVNLGVGMPEEVGRLVYEGGLFEDLTFSAETGVYGGLPAPGAFFGAAINPQKLYSSAYIFEHYKENLDVTVLGLMQVDSNGNVNVSRKSKEIDGAVGPGGFIDIAQSAKKIIFVGNWMAKGEFKLEDGKLSIVKKGIPKFVDEMYEITFNGYEALKKGKEIYYATTVGIFQLTEKGIELIQVMPGIDVERDIMATSTAKILVSDNLVTVPDSIATGKNFKLAWED